MALNPEGKKAMAEWLKTKPQSVQDFAAKQPFVPGDRISTVKGVVYLLGYGEQEGGKVCFLVTPIDPAKDYEGAVQARVPICAEHFDGKKLM